MPALPGKAPHALSVRGGSLASGATPRATRVNVLAFDIETVPDVESGRRLLALEGLGDAEVARIMRQMSISCGDDAPGPSGP